MDVWVNFIRRLQNWKVRKIVLFTFCCCLFTFLFTIFKVRNAKRQQLQVQERFVAADGFMLNFLSVMQHLSSKVKMGQVDIFYLHRYALLLLH